MHAFGSHKQRSFAISSAYIGKAMRIKPHSLMCRRVKEAENVGVERLPREFCRGREKAAASASFLRPRWRAGAAIGGIADQRMA